MDKRLIIAEIGCNMRLDVFVTKEMDITRSYVKCLVGEGNILFNGKQVKAGQIVKTGDTVEVTLKEEVTDIAPEDIPVTILYEDNDIAIINKKQGMTVHPASGSYTGTLVNALLFHLKSLSSINGVIRPGIVHRLDKFTSGIMVVAKNNKAHLSLSEQIATRSVDKYYLAILEGNLPQDSGVIDACIARSEKDRKMMAIDDDGREAITEFEVVQRFKNNCLVRFKILTGRTHQIRVHAKYLRHPVLGDTVYGFSKQRFSLNGQLLHAYELGFSHPEGNARVNFKAPLPEHFLRIYNILARESSEKSMFSEEGYLCDLKLL